MAFELDTKFFWKASLLIFFALVLPYLLGSFGFRTPWGFGIRFFQLGVLLAAALYGPLGGFAAGIIGSAASSFGNLYAVLFNGFFGLVAGFFVSRRIGVVPAALTAFVLGLPALVFIDYFLGGVPFSAVQADVTIFFVITIFWSYVAAWAVDRLKLREIAALKGA